jgi:hypothetical protein
VQKTATGALSTSATAKDGNRRANNSVPKTATRSTGPLAGRRPRSTTHQGWDTYTYKRLHIALSDMLGVGRVLMKEGIRRRGHGHDGGYGDLQGGPDG